MLCLVTHSCPTLCVSMDCSLTGSSVHGILRQEYWSGLPCPPPGDLPSPGIEPRCPTLQVDLPSELPILSYESVDWIKQVALPNAGGPYQSLEGLDRKKKKGGRSSPVKRTPAWLLNLDISLFLPLDSNWNIGFSWDCKHTGFCIGSYVISSPASQPFWLGLKLYHWFWSSLLTYCRFWVLASVNA